MEFHHVPVLLKATIDMLSPKPGGTYVDCTIGGAGHAVEIVKKIGPEGRLIGIDRDRDALQAANRKLEGYHAQCILIQGNFMRLESLLLQEGITNVDGFLFDLGVSSYQLDHGERGFSYQEDAPLDMRMDRTETRTAADLVNELSQEELAKLIWEYGEERWSHRIAEFIVNARKERPITTTGQLVNIIKAAIPARARRVGPHPAKRTFQALRIAINNELNGLKHALQKAIDFLVPAGRICVISFHSLEDRIVKHTFQEEACPCKCPPHLPVCTCGRQARIKIITRKPIIPQPEEVNQNPRARSAKLRVAEKIAEQYFVLNHEGVE